MHKQLKIASKNSFHSHASFLLPGPFPSAQKRGSICCFLQLSPHGSRCIDLLLSCSAQVSVPALQPLSKFRPPVPGCRKGCPRLWRHQPSCCLLGWLPFYCVAKRHLQWQTHLSAVKLRKSKKELPPRPEWTNPSTPTTSLPHWLANFELLQPLLLSIECIMHVST